MHHYLMMRCHNFPFAFRLLFILTATQYVFFFFEAFLSVWATLDYESMMRIPGYHNRLAIIFQ